MVGIVVIHDGLLSPLVVGVGWLLARTVPPRGRRYTQAALIICGLITIIAIPLIARQGTQPPAKALLLQSYGANLAILLGLVAALNLVAYLVTAARNRRSDAPTSGFARGCGSWMHTQTSTQADCRSRASAVSCSNAIAFAGVRWHPSAAAVSGDLRRRAVADTDGRRSSA